VFTHLEESVPFATVLQFEIEDVLVKRLGFLKVVYLYGDVITP
jgi:hypothetical protein